MIDCNIINLKETYYCIATYYKVDKLEPTGEVNMDKFRIAKFKHESLDHINIYKEQIHYRSSNMACLPPPPPFPAVS